MPRLRALLASLRIANAPSAVSNVWLGYMLGVYYWGNGAHFGADLVLLSLIALCLLFAGNLFNDWFDRDWDRTHRPERALPKGDFSPGTYLIGASLLSLLACWFALSLGVTSLAITGAILVLILAYTRIHKQSRWAVVPMGLCRAGLYLLGMNACIPAYWKEKAVGVVRGTDSVNPNLFPPTDMGLSIAFALTHALGLFAYVVGLTLTARYESNEHPPHGMILLSRGMLFLPLAAMSAWWMPHYPLPASIALVPFAFWLTLALTRMRRPIPRFVSALLGGIPLVDAIAMVPLCLALCIPGRLTEQDPRLLVSLAVPILAFALALLLQRLAPAT